MPFRRCLQPDAFRPAPSIIRARTRLAFFGLGLAALGFGGCAQQPQQFAAAKHGKEYFPSSIYGRASRRVIADGQPVPHGGGQYLVGKPYTVAGQTYYPSERKITQIGFASWYGDAFHGRLTANGEIYDRDSFTAAHPTMPLPSYARVTNLTNHYSMIVRVNDRGPYASNRVMDVSRKVAEALDFKRFGTARVKVEYIGRASLAGSDDAKLYATLSRDTPAVWRGEQPSLFAEIEAAPARIASLTSFAIHPTAMVENERPERLAPYRASRPQRPALPRSRSDEDGRETMSDRASEDNTRDDRLLQRRGDERLMTRSAPSRQTGREHTRPEAEMEIAERRADRRYGSDGSPRPHRPEASSNALIQTSDSRFDRLQRPSTPREDRTIRTASREAALARMIEDDRRSTLLTRVDRRGPSRRDTSVALPPARPSQLRAARAGERGHRAADLRGGHSRDG